MELGCGIIEEFVVGSVNLAPEQTVVTAISVGI